MLIDREVILGTEKIPLMTLEEYSINPKKYNFEKAQKELLRYEKEKAENRCTWGYFPMMQQEEAYPECKELEKQLYQSFIPQIDRNLKLAFIRVASKQPKSKYGGMHIDVDIGVGHKRTNTKEVIRILINLHHHPRILEYCSLDINQLKKRGISVPSNKYSILSIPKSLIKKIKIPPRRNNSIYLLRFYSSKIPHAGNTNKKGHYLIALGTYKAY